MDKLLNILKNPNIKVIAFDLDGVLCQEVCWNEEEVSKATPVKKMVELCNELYKNYFIVIYTARRDNLIGSTIKWLRENGVMFQAISNNKMGADLYLDDKAINSNDI